MADVANEPSVHFVGSIALSNQEIVPRSSSAQPLNSRSNINIHGQVETNINLSVHRPEYKSNRINVINNAHIANNIMQNQ